MRGTERIEVKITYCVLESMVHGVVAGGRYEVQKRNRPRESEVVPLTFTTRGSVLVLARGEVGEDGAPSA